LKTLAVALLTLCANFAHASGLELSAKDKRILLEEAKWVAKEYPSIPMKGVDLSNGEVRATIEEKTKLQKQLDEMQEAGSAYQTFVKKCEFDDAKKPHPKVVYDIAVLKGMGWNGGSVYMGDYFAAFTQACSNPPNDAIKSFVQNIRAIHIEAAGFDCAGDYDKTKPKNSCGDMDGAIRYMKLDPKTKELRMGLELRNHNDPMGQVVTWLKDQ